MVSISPQQEIFTAVRVACMNLNYNVYDYLPKSDVPYPFVFIGEDFSTDVANKTSVHGLYNLTIHVYHNDYKKRGTTTNMMMSIKQTLREMKTTQSFFVSIRNLSDQILADNTTNTPLLHGVIEVEFYFN